MKFLELRELKEIKELKTNALEANVVWFEGCFELGNILFGS